MTGQDFKSSIVFVSHIAAGLSGQEWFLVWGKRIGGTGTALLIRLYAFDGKEVQTIWNGTVWLEAGYKFLEVRLLWITMSGMLRPRSASNAFMGVCM